MDRMRDRLRYRVMHGSDEASLARLVSAALDEGYELYGSPVITGSGDGMVFAQAVILPPYATSAPRIQPVDTAKPQEV